VTGASGIGDATAGDSALAGSGAAVALEPAGVTALAQTGLDAADLGALAALLALVGIVAVFGAQNREPRRRRTH
jgi:hypothetical protein